MHTRPSRDLAIAALSVAALTLAACGGGTSSPPASAPAGASAPAATAAPPSTAPEVSASAPAISLPSFDPSEILANLEGIDSYRITVTSGGQVGYQAVVVTKPVLSRDIRLGEGEDAQRVVSIGDETWMGTGDALQPAPAALAGSLLAAFDPLMMAGAFAQPGAWSGANDQGVEEKNGVQARHFRIEAGSVVGTLASMPPGTSIDAWVAEDGGYLVSLAVVGEASEGFTIDVTNVNDPTNVVKRPS